MKMENHKTKGMAGTRNYRGLNLTLIQTLRQKIEALRESEEKFEIIFESIPDGILLADISTMKFSIGNKAILHMLGYTMDEIKKMSVNDIHPKKDLP
jgi:PAS domain-containing protein